MLLPAGCLILAAVLTIQPWNYLNSSLFAVTLDDYSSEIRTGRELYDYYCYQCHGYSGDAKTLASTYLDPAPADFTQATLSAMTSESMLNTVRNGRPGTAMVSFTTVMNDEEVQAVVDYIRESFMSSGNASERYHTRENGWPEHERFASAFPFVSGEIPLDTPWEELDRQQYEGKLLYINACISCHDHGRKAVSTAVWEIRAVSYPRKHYSHRLENTDALSGASVHLIHEKPPVGKGMTVREMQGRKLYLDNCAFCHAPDGSARNWIGSFLNPPPRRFTENDFIRKSSDEKLETAILEGIPGTSMPAWKHVLTSDQVKDIVIFLRGAFDISALSSKNTDIDHRSEIDPDQ